MKNINNNELTTVELASKLEKQSKKENLDLPQLKRCTPSKLPSHLNSLFDVTLCIKNKRPLFHNFPPNIYPL